MKIFIDIGHPAHVHLFKNFAWEMIKKGHEILFTARDKEYEIYLLKKYDFNYDSFGKHYPSKIGKILGLIKFNILLLIQSIKFKPDVFLSHGSIYAAHVSFLMRKPHIALEDSGNMEQIRLYRPFTEVILTPNVLQEELGNKQVRYKGYHELSYLLPNYFKPDKSIFNALGIKSEEEYCVFRFVSWKATHDKDQSGFKLKDKFKLVELLSKKLRVFISSEGGLPVKLREYQINISPERMHDALAFATLFIGEGATMASEAGVLGTPSIYVNTLVRQYNEDQEKYGLVFNFRSGEGVLKKALELLNTPDLKRIHQERRKKMLADKIDVTAFMVWFVENYPESVQIMKKNPRY